MKTAYQPGDGLIILVIKGGCGTYPFTTNLVIRFRRGQGLVEDGVLDPEPVPEVLENEGAVLFKLELSRHVVAVEVAVLY